MKKHFFTAALLSSFFLASCDKEKVEPTPAVEATTATADARVGESRRLLPGETIPFGWVVTERNAFNETTITYIAGAPYLYSVEIEGNSPILAGWVFTRQFAGKIRLTNMKGAPAFASIEVLRSSPIPPRYVIDRDDALFRITNLNGARRGARIEVVGNSPVPTGWRVVSTFGSKKTLENTQDF